MDTLRYADGTPLEPDDLLAILSRLKGYIEVTEEALDATFEGLVEGRSFEEIHKEGGAPHTYDQIVEIISANSQ